MDVALRVYYSTVKGRLFYPYDQTVYYPTVKGRLFYPYDQRVYYPTVMSRLLYGCGTKGLLFDGEG
jgi:hypothetical protein